MELSQEPDLSQLVGLNDPIDQQWNERRKLQKQNSTLNERRQQLKEMKQQYLQESIKEQQVMPVQAQKSQGKLQVIINKEIAYQFQQGIEKFKEKSTRDQGISICKRLIESNRDLAGVYTLIDVLNSSSKKQIDPKTNNTNILSLDLELITLSEIIKQNQEIIINLKEKIYELALRHLNTDSESTLQAISSVFISLFDILQIEQISKVLLGQLTNRSTQNQSIGVLCIIFYYVYQKQNPEQIKLLASKIVDTYQKILLESLELLNCIELIISYKILDIDPKEYINRTLKYCQQPINKTAIYYLIVVQACRILQIIGGFTRVNQNQVLFELNKLSSDRRVAVQMAAKAALASWRDQDINASQNNQQILEKCYQKINFTNIQYQDYQQKGFTSLMRASTFVRKGSGSPTVRKQEIHRSQTPKQIRQKIKRIKSDKPTQFQLLPEPIEQQAKQINFTKDDIDNQEMKQEDSLEKIQLDNVQEINEEQQYSQKISINSIRMPTVKHIDTIPDLQKSIQNQILDDQVVDVKQQNQIVEVNQQIMEVKQQASIMEVNQQAQVIEVKQQAQIVGGKQENKIEEIKKQNSIVEVKQQVQRQQSGKLVQQEFDIQIPTRQKEIKVATQNKNPLNQEVDIQYEEINSNYLNQPIQQVNKFDKSFSFQFDEIKSKNNKINYEGLDQDSLVIENKQNILEDSLEQNFVQQFNVQDDPQEKFSSDQKFQKVKQQKLGEGKDTIKEIHNEVEFDEEVQQDNIKIVEQQVEQKAKIEQIDPKQIIKSDLKDINKQVTTQQSKVQEQIKVNKVQDQPEQINKQQLDRSDKQVNQKQNNKQDSVNSIQKQNQQIDVKSNHSEAQFDLNQTLEQVEDAELIQISQSLKMDQFYFKKSLQLFEQGNLDSAYSSIMDNCDCFSLIRFMMITGPCISKLSQRNINRLIEKLSFINKQEVTNQQTLILCSQIINLQLLQELNLEQIGNIKTMINSCQLSSDQIISQQGYELFQNLQL
ncbi:hypothetical protein pb186bvf_014128 [Paramecium bursaria]